MNEMTLLSERSVPTNLQAEQALLGALLANNTAYDAVSPFLRAEYFADPVNGRVYEAIARRIDAGLLADAVTLHAEFANSGVLDEVGGPGYLAQLLVAMVSVRSAGAYGRAVHEAWARRQLIDIAETLRERAFGDASGVAARELIEEAEGKLYDLAERGEVETACSPAHEAMALAIDAAVKASQQPGGLVGLTTGYAALDDITGGLRRGQFALLAARPSMGKTTLALGIAAGAAAAGARVLFVSLEMNREAIGGVLTAGTAGLPRDATERGRLRGRDDTGRFTYAPIGQSHVDRMVAAQRAMANRTLMIDECRARSMSSVRASARRMKRRGGLDLIVVDYVGLMRVPELARSDNRTLEVSRLSGDTKALATDLDVPVLMLSQINRGTEGREDKKPGLSDLRDSGSLEQDADLAMFIYREHYYLSRAEPARRQGESDDKFGDRMALWTTAEQRARGRAEILIPKQRRGRVGTVLLGFDDDSAWFSDFQGEA